MSELKYLPEKIEATAIGFMDGRNGYAVQNYRNSEYKINITYERQNSRSKFIAIYSSDYIKNKEFASFNELRAELIRQGHFTGLKLVKK